MANMISRVVPWLAIAAACGGSSSPPSSSPTVTGAVVGPQETRAGATVPTRKAEVPRPFHANVLQAARANDAYRRILFTGARSQLALMTIPPGGDVGLEMHPHIEQLVFIASGHGKAILDGVESPAVEGDVIVATPGTRHDIVNNGREPLRIYTVYAPPNHIDGTLHRTKADAEADKADEAFGSAVR